MTIAVAIIAIMLLLLTVPQQTEIASARTTWPQKLRYLGDRMASAIWLVVMAVAVGGLLLYAG